MKTETYTLPGFWASYLINGDATGFDYSDNGDADKNLADAWLESHQELGACLNCSDNPEFTHWHDARPEVLACDCLEFTFPVLPEPRIIFRKFKEGDVIALLPDNPANYGKVDSYQHVGQHGESDLAITRSTVKATPEEYGPLLRELQGIYGRQFRIMARLSGPIGGWRK